MPSLCNGFSDPPHRQHRRRAGTAWPGGSVCAGRNMPHGVCNCAGVLAEESHHVLLPGAGRLHATLMALEERCASACMLSTCGRGQWSNGWLLRRVITGDSRACRLQRIEGDVRAIREAVQARSTSAPWEPYLVGAAAGVSSAAVLGWVAYRVNWRTRRM